MPRLYFFSGILPKTLRQSPSSVAKHDSLMTRVAPQVRSRFLASACTLRLLLSHKVSTLILHVNRAGRLSARSISFEAGLGILDRLLLKSSIILLITPLWFLSIWILIYIDYQVNSKRETAAAFGFGTATRDAALKQYGVWTTKR